MSMTTSAAGGAWLNITLQTSGTWAPIGLPNLVTAPPLEGLLESAHRVTALPDHEFRAFPAFPVSGLPGSREHLVYPPNRRRWFCADCPPGSIYMDDPGSHPYVIHEWELG